MVLDEGGFVSAVACFPVSVVGGGAAAATTEGVTSSFFSSFSGALFSFFSVGLGDALPEPPILRTFAGPVDAADGSLAEGVPAMGARGGGRVGRPLDLVPSAGLSHKARAGIPFAAVAVGGVCPRCKTWGDWYVACCCCCCCCCGNPCSAP